MKKRWSDTCHRSPVQEINKISPGVLEFKDADRRTERKFLFALILGKPCEECISSGKVTVSL
jgi:hypothetical protein